LYEAVKGEIKKTQRIERVSPRLDPELAELKNEGGVYRSEPELVFRFVFTLERLLKRKVGITSHTFCIQDVKALNYLSLNSGLKHEKI
jgi:hypothetical protein